MRSLRTGLRNGHKAGAGAEIQNQVRFGFSSLGKVIVMIRSVGIIRIVERNDSWIIVSEAHLGLFRSQSFPSRYSMLHQFLHCLGTARPLAATSIRRVQFAGYHAEYSRQHRGHHAPALTFQDSSLGKTRNRIA